MSIPKSKRTSIHDFDDAIRNYPEVLLKDLFQTPKKGSVEERFSVYANGYGVRTRASMEEVYEVLSHYMGEERWLELGDRYTKAYPSTSYNLADVGMALPKFLRDQSYEPAFVDLAELELCVWRSFHAKRSTPLTLDDFSRVTEDSRFFMQPATCLWKSESSVASLWKNRGKGAAEARCEWAVIYRKDFAVNIEQIGEAQFKLLTALSEEASLGEALDRIQFNGSDEVMSGWLRSWMENQYFQSHRRDS